MNIQNNGQLWGNKTVTNKSCEMCAYCGGLRLHCGCSCVCLMIFVSCMLGVLQLSNSSMVTSTLRIVIM